MVLVRLIPAHAGKTTPGYKPECGSWAHPRSRGENSTRARRSCALRGSSPLTRGKPADRALSGKWSGLIPAHAGKTEPPARGPRPPAAHPRSRGENIALFKVPVFTPGSSPLTRGKPTSRLCRIVPPGLIPAHAGKTSGQDTPTVGHWAHPRSRGENPQGTLS